MLRLLIVDDEPDIREMIISLIDWRGRGLELAGQAIDGREALELIRSEKVDLLLTDLRMPVMNGLDLLAEAMKLRPGLAAAVLSAYDEFKLVKSAFMLGARDYLLKSELTRESVDAVLAKLTRELEREKPGGLEPALRGLFLDGAAPAEAGELLSALGLDLTRARLMVCRGRLDPDSCRPDGAGFELRAFLAAAAGEVPAAGLALSEREFALLLGFPAEADWELARRGLDAIFAERKAAAARAGLRLSVGASGLGGPGAAPAALLAEAGRALEAGFIRGRGRLIHAACLAGLAGRPRLPAGRVQLAAFEELLASLDAGGPSAEGLSAVCLQERSLHPDDVAEARQLYSNYSLLAGMQLERRGEAAGPAARGLIEDFTGRLAAEGDLADYNRWLLALLKELGSGLAGCSAVVRRAVRYIHEHQREPLDLSRLAGALGVNASYLSRSFSRQMGRTLLAYIAEVKIEKAVRLIRDGGRRIHEVSDCLGFENSEHFSRVFKKVTGRSPSRYLRRS